MLNQYFEAKKRLYPQNVKGRFRKIKWLLNFFFLSFYFLSSFVRFDRGDLANNQAILIDLPNGHAYFFWIEIWPQEVYYLAGILIISAITLFFITSLFGRIWCGYACFQTVWVDIFIAIERFFQGDRNDRILLDRKNSFKKFYKKFLTHFVWIIFSLLTGFAFVCYFNDSISLVKKIFFGDIPANILGWILGIASMTYIMAGFARDHVCTYMCPYARFQSAMFDNNTLVIGYDQKRGEPRNKMEKNSDFSQRGHCIDCKQCVVVCPQGIDIRNGLQMECIACGLCIDACDNVMEKIGLPKGLIRYDTLSGIENQPNKKKFRILQPRTFFYSTIIIVITGFMLSCFIFRNKIETEIIPDRNPLFVKLSDGRIRNGYTLKITNKNHQEQNFFIKSIFPEGLKLKIQNVENINDFFFVVPLESSINLRFFLIGDSNLIINNKEKRLLVDIVLTNKVNNENYRAETIFIFDN